jgi:hypothetical protein
LAIWRGFRQGNSHRAIDLLRAHYIYWGTTGKGYILSRRSGYSAQKRRRELAKQKKRKAKEERKLHRGEQDEDSLVAEYLGLEVESEEETDEESEDEEQDEETSG